jgi:hypothetical protein
MTTMDKITRKIAAGAMGRSAEAMRRAAIGVYREAGEKLDGGGAAVKLERGTDVELGESYTARHYPGAVGKSLRKYATSS